MWREKEVLLLVLPKDYLWPVHEEPKETEELQVQAVPERGTYKYGGYRQLRKRGRRKGRREMWMRLKKGAKEVEREAANVRCVPRGGLIRETGRRSLQKKGIGKDRKGRVE